MFWQRKKKRALEEAVELERQRVVTEKEFLEHVHEETTRVQRLQSLLTDIRRMQTDVKGRKRVRKGSLPSRKRKSSSRK